MTVVRFYNGEQMGLCYNSGHDDKIVISERKINHVQNPPELR